MQVNTYGGESGVTIFALINDRLTMAGIFFGIRKKPLDRLLVVVVLLALDNDL